MCLTHLCVGAAPLSHSSLCLWEAGGRLGGGCCGKSPVSSVHSYTSAGIILENNYKSYMISDWVSGVQVYPGLAPSGSRLPELLPGDLSVCRGADRPMVRGS